MTGWKTYIFGLLVTLLSQVQVWDWASLIPDNPRLVGWIGTGIGAAIIVLRSITTGPAPVSLVKPPVS